MRQKLMEPQTEIDKSTITAFSVISILRQKISNDRVDLHSTTNQLDDMTFYNIPSSNNIIHSLLKLTRNSH